MLTTTDLNTWIQTIPALAGYFSAAVPLALSKEPGYIPPDIPNSLLVWTPFGGVGELMERTFDAWAVQLLVRGDQGDSAGAQQLISDVDDAIMGLHAPFTINGKRCADLSYSGSPPTWVGRDTARREHWTVSYVMTVARNSAAF